MAELEIVEKYIPYNGFILDGSNFNFYPRKFYFKKTVHGDYEIIYDKFIGLFHHTQVFDDAETCEFYCKYLREP